MNIITIGTGWHSINLDYKSLLLLKLILIQHLYHPCRASDRYFVITYIMCYDRCSSYDSILPYRYSGQNCCSGSDPCTILYYDRLASQDSLHIKAVLIKKKIIQIHYKYSLIISPYRGIGIYHYYFLE